MWICTNKAFLSIVQPDAFYRAKHGDVLLVRARVKGHIESVFCDAEVERRPGRDYLYRAYVERRRVAGAIAKQLEGISYPNFKGSVKDDELHRAYMQVWNTMARLQMVPPYGKDSAAARKREETRVKGVAPRGRQKKLPLADRFADVDEADQCGLSPAVQEWLDTNYPDH